MQSNIAIIHFSINWLYNAESHIHWLNCLAIVFLGNNLLSIPTLKLFTKEVLGWFIDADIKRLQPISAVWWYNDVLNIILL